MIQAPVRRRDAHLLAGEIGGRADRRVAHLDALAGMDVQR